MLPATDLYLMGREATHNAPRGLTLAHKLAGDGVLCSVATNNVLNPFTPFGDASLLRMANFYANVAHASVSDFDTCLDLVTELPARLMNLSDYGIEVGNPADLVVLDTQDSRFAIAELPDIVMGFKSGRQTFERQRPTLFRPGADRLFRALRPTRGLRDDHRNRPTEEPDGLRHDLPERALRRRSPASHRRQRTAASPRSRPSMQPPAGARDASTSAMPSSFPASSRATSISTPASMATPGVRTSHAPTGSTCMSASPSRPRTWP